MWFLHWIPNACSSGTKLLYARCAGWPMATSLGQLNVYKLFRPFRFRQEIKVVLVEYHRPGEIQLNNLDTLCSIWRLGREHKFASWSVILPWKKQRSWVAMRVNVARYILKGNKVPNLAGRPWLYCWVNRTQAVKPFRLIAILRKYNHLLWALNPAPIREKRVLAV